MKDDRGILLLTVLPTSALAVAVWLALRQLAKLFRKPKLDMPHLCFTDGDNSPQRYAQQSGGLLERGYEQYSKKGLPFSMYNHADRSRPIAVLPVKYLAEIRNAASAELSFSSYLNTTTIAHDIGAPLVTDRVIHLVRHDLNKSLNDLIQPLQQVCEKLVPGLVSPCPDWTPHNAFYLLMPLVSRLMARVLVGPELWDSDEWHGVIMAYFQAGGEASRHVRDTYPPWLRWTSRYLDKNVKAIYATRRRGQEILKPVIEARLAEATGSGSAPARGHGPRFQDGIGWLVDSYMTDNHFVQTDHIMQDQAFLVAASIHSISLTALSALLDLVDHADAIAEIREEIATVFAEHGGWTRQSLAALRLLDSFMKESQRFNNFQYNTMQRLAVVDYTFKDGLRIPAGTSIVVPSRLLGRDPDLHGRDADKFDAKRWLRRREQGDATKFHFASLQDDMLPWGSGPHACPGRFLAQDMIKLVLVHLLTQYDLKFPEGVEGRPADIPENTNSNPNMMAQILFKGR
ncbi:cytochrome p450 protein [Apiospora kogelbergensis]|uniref:Cytochrome p450 protein n=1 Tax=Apiospora kogelbergensis TaxID=1337665 RepID=A0AAW0QGT6_9PEZI